MGYPETDHDSTLRFGDHKELLRVHILPLDCGGVATPMAHGAMNWRR
jgi:hypothetical protein